MSKVLRKFKEQMVDHFQSIEDDLGDPDQEFQMTGTQFIEAMEECDRRKKQLVRELQES